VSIAHQIGGHWPETARRAARVLSGEGVIETVSTDIMLLEDLRGLFESTGPVRRRASM
jgi:hypothetical protein